MTSDINGKIILFQHGINAGRNEFYKMVNKICSPSNKSEKTPEFINGGVITLRDDLKNIGKLKSIGLLLGRKRNILNIFYSNPYKSIEVPEIILDKMFLYEINNLLPENEIINQEKLMNMSHQQRIEFIKNSIKTLRNKGKYILFRTEFSNPEGSHDSQKLELSKIVDFLTGKETDNKSILLVGHSKGGLINLGYAEENSDKIDKIISIGTPYRKSLMARIFKNFFPKNKGLNDLASEPKFSEKNGDEFLDNINNVKTRYLINNKNIKKGEVIAIACKKGSFGDGVVSEYSQTAGGYANIYSLNQKIGRHFHCTETKINKIVYSIEQLIPMDIHEIDNRSLCKIRDENQDTTLITSKQLLQEKIISPKENGILTLNFRERRENIVLTLINKLDKFNKYKDYLEEQIGNDLGTNNKAKIKMAIASISKGILLKKVFCCIQYEEQIIKNIHKYNYACKNITDILKQIDENSRKINKGVYTYPQTRKNNLNPKNHVHGF